VVIARGLRDERPLAVKRFRESSGYLPEYMYRQQPLPAALEAARSAILSLFIKRIRYLGPLRDDPRTLYALPPTPEDPDVGIRGEYTATVLQCHAADLVDCPVPGDAAFGCVRLPLGEAVTRWLVHMGLVEEVETTDKGKIGTEVSLRVADVSMPLDLTNVGVGVSQVLPSIVAGLLAPSGTVLLLEQPELHLHPKVQSILADFLLGLAHNGRQCIVESHSEYLVNRLRRRIVEAPGDRVKRLIQLYFVERTNGASEFRSVEPNEYGAIPDWPRGFFDQGPDEAQIIIRAAAAKRQQKSDALRSPAKEQ
jgi:predicted ATPase